MTKIAIHDNGIFKNIITGETLGSNPHHFLSAGDKYIDKNNIECTIISKNFLEDGTLIVNTQENSAPLVEQQIIDLATNEYIDIPQEVKQKIKLWDKVKGWLK
ncbi:MAG: hypothetical protein Q8906_05985 [Bacillota bacterium]|nr:hypothetical protein [Bacillota bacterium]